MKKNHFIVFFMIIFVVIFSQSCVTLTISKKPVTITLWHLDTQDDLKVVWQQQVDDFMAANPHVIIRITVLENEAFKQKLATVMQSGNPPDVFRSWGGGVMNMYAEAGMLKDITKEIKSANLGIAKGPLEVYSYRGKLYGVPFNMGAVGIWYNIKIFRKYGLSEFETWNELIAGCKKLRESGVTPISLGAQDKWPSMFYLAYIAMRINGEFGIKSVYSRNSKFTDPGWIDAFKKIKELVDIGAFQNGFLGDAYNDQSSLVANGEAAMELMGQWAPYVQEQQTSDRKGLGGDLGFMPFPEIEGGKGKITDMFGGGDGYCIGKNAPKEAVEFLKFMMGKEQYKKLYDSPIVILPVIIGTEDWVEEPNMKKIVKYNMKADNYQLYLDQLFPPSVSEEILDAVQGVLGKRITPEEAARMIQGAWEKEQ